VEFCLVQNVAFHLKELNSSLHSQPHAVVHLSTRDKETLPALVRSLAHVDAHFAVEIENTLVKLGATIIPEMIEGLHHPSNKVQSVCATVLIRLGQSCVPAVQQFYGLYRHDAYKAYMASFVLQQLCAPLTENIKPFATTPAVARLYAS
jgi:hypothetical protein